jgi:hypothetical protein
VGLILVVAGMDLWAGLSALEVFLAWYPGLRPGLLWGGPLALKAKSRLSVYAAIGTREKQVLRSAQDDKFEVV